MGKKKNPLINILRSLRAADSLWTFPTHSVDFNEVLKPPVNYHCRCVVKGKAFENTLLLLATRVKPGQALADLWLFRLNVCPGQPSRVCVQDERSSRLVSGAGSSPSWMLPQGKSGHILDFRVARKYTSVKSTSWRQDLSPPCYNYSQNSNVFTSLNPCNFNVVIREYKPPVFAIVVERQPGNGINN